MSIAHECKCGLISPVPESQGGKRLRCKGCGTISMVVKPEVLEPDPVPVPVAAVQMGEDTAPPPPPQKPFKYRRQVSREEERESYPRTGGVIDWRQVYDGDENDYHHDPVPPDPQMRHLNPPDTNPGGRALSIALGVMMLLGSLIWVLLSFVVFPDLLFVGLAVGLGIFVVGFGLLVHGCFGRSG